MGKDVTGWGVALQQSRRFALQCSPKEEREEEGRREERRGLEEYRFSEVRKGDWFEEEVK